MNPVPSIPELSVILVDDERLARLQTRRILEQHPDIVITAEAGDLAAARGLLATHRPHLLFLDVQLSPGSGFDLLPDLPATTAVVFLTAHSEHAVRAFEANALDYLLKPTSVERMAAALDRARMALCGPSPERAIFVGTKSNWKRLPTAQISAIVADGVYSRIVARTGGDHLMHRGLNHWEIMLADSGFVRIDRSLLINRMFVQGFRSLGRDQSWLEIDGFAEPIKLGRAGTYRARRILENVGSGF
jgi:two-component system, LytTR family, response regulator